MILASAIFDQSNGDIENLKWEHEKTITMDSDMREPYFLALDGSLIFYFFKAGTNPIAFEPDFIYSTRFSRLYDVPIGLKSSRKPFQVTLNDNQWSEPEQGLKEGEIIWQMAYERGTYYSRKGYSIFMAFSSTNYW